MENHPDNSSQNISSIANLLEPLNISDRIEGFNGVSHKNNFDAYKSSREDVSVHVHTNVGVGLYGPQSLSTFGLSNISNQDHLKEQSLFTQSMSPGHQHENTRSQVRSDDGITTQSSYNMPYQSLPIICSESSTTSSTVRFLSTNKHSIHENISKIQDDINKKYSSNSKLTNVASNVNNSLRYGPLLQNENFISDDDMYRNLTYPLNSDEEYLGVSQRSEIRKEENFMCTYVNGLQNPIQGIYSSLRDPCFIGDGISDTENLTLADTSLKINSSRHSVHENYSVVSNISNIKDNVEVLGPEEIRWFYKTGDKKWIPFIGYDSLKIEWAYRDYVHKILSEDSSSQHSSDNINSSKYLNEIPQLGKPVVCGGLYEVDVSLLKGSSIYWKDEEFVIMRGTWFYEWNWLPVEANIAKQIEVEHLARFKGNNFSSDDWERESQQGAIHTMSLSEGHVDWFSSGDVFFSHDATPSRLMRSVSKKFGFQKTGYKLHRGYCFDASLDDKPPDITHIVFVIHGIGQNMETGRIIKNCTSLRESIKWLKEKQFPNHDFSRQTFEFFPVEWRSSLTLDNGIIDSITPHKIIGLRQMLNASFMDIMYYNSPQYREEIVNGLTSELDRLYTMFTARNPYFEANGGKVSVIAHSLGCVITYDIVTGWSPAPQMNPGFLQALLNLTQKKADSKEERSLYHFQTALQHVLQKQLDKSNQPRLRFKIENFFCLGSPLAVFLGLRRREPGDETMAPFVTQSSFRRMFNIFHPADPVAYRIEPLLCSKFCSVAPVVIHSYAASIKTPYHEIPPELLRSTSPRPSTSRAEASSDPVSGDSLSVGLMPGGSMGASWNFWSFMKQPKKSTELSTPEKSLEDVTANDMMKHRVDFVLREGSMESSYLSAITSHTAYWSNMDVANFLLTTFCPHVLEEPSTE